jgi:hypothetical protein
MGGLSANSSSMTSSFLAVDEDMDRFSDGISSPERVVRDAPFSTSDQDFARSHSQPEERPERQREKRSLVVDDLASRIRSSALTSCS